MAESKIQGIYDSGWQNIPEGTASGYDKLTLTPSVYRKVGKTVFIMGAYAGSGVSAGWKNIGCLPLECRPSQMIYDSGANRGSQGYEIQIQVNGNIFINSNATLTNISLLLSFPV